MKRLFITRPRYDPGTDYLYNWSEEIIHSAEELNWKVDKSDGFSVTRNEVESRLQKTKPNFVFFNGHGNEHQMYGHNYEIILDENSSHLLRDTITFTRACNCIIGLGKSSVGHGCKAFIGYAGEFWIPKINKYLSTPLKDSGARPVLEVSNLVPLSILKGLTVQESVSVSRKHASKYFLKLILSEELYDRSTLKALIQNDSVLSYVGDSSAKIC